MSDDDEMQAIYTKLKVLFWQHIEAVGGWQLTFFLYEDGHREIHNRACRLDPCTCPPHERMSSRPMSRSFRKEVSDQFDRTISEFVQNFRAKSGQ